LDSLEAVQQGLISECISDIFVLLSLGWRFVDTVCERVYYPPCYGK